VKSWKQEKQFVFEFDDVRDSAHLSDKVNLFQDLTGSLLQIIRQKKPIVPRVEDLVLPME